MASEVKVNPIVMVPMAKIRMNTWNQNVQSPDTFNALVDHIVEVGFSGAVDLRRLPDEEIESDEEYEIVGGEHRFKAAQILQMEEIPATIYEGWDRDKAEAETIAFNILSGKLDPIKFTASFNRLSAKYGEELTRKMMSFADESEFKRVYQRTRSALPQELRSKLDDHKDELKTVDDLSVLLHELMRKHGRTVDRSYMWFRYGGRTHLMVTMDKTVLALVKRITDRSDEAGADVNEIFATVLQAGMVEWSDGRASTGDRPANRRGTGEEAGQGDDGPAQGGEAEEPAAADQGQADAGDGDAGPEARAPEGEGDEAVEAGQPETTGTGTPDEPATEQPAADEAEADGATAPRKRAAAGAKA